MSLAKDSLLFYNASVVHTMGPPAVAAWCVNGDGLITAVSSSLSGAAKACPNAARVSLRGAVVLPGLIDSHLHLMYGGLMLSRPQLDTATSPAGVAKQLQEWVRAHGPLPAAGWLQGFGWDQELFASKAFPTRADLDAAFPHTPVWLIRIDGHAAWANSEALRRAAPLPAADPPGGRIIRDPATGEPTGIFTDRSAARRPPVENRVDSASRRAPPAPAPLSPPAGRWT